VQQCWGDNGVPSLSLPHDGLLWGLPCDRQLFDHLKLVLYDATEQLDKTEKKIEMMQSK
jgi:hypothetical protein